MSQQSIALGQKDEPSGVDLHSFLIAAKIGCASSEPDDRILVLRMNGMDGACPFQGIETEDLPESLLDAGVDDAALGYGKAMKFFFEEQKDQYLSELEQIVQDTNWAAFGHIAAEADLARD